MRKALRITIMLVILALCPINLHVSAKPVNDRGDGKDTRSIAVAEHGIKKRDIFDWIYSYLADDESDDSFLDVDDDDDDETYLICRNCTVVVNQGNGEVIPPTRSTKAPVITQANDAPVATASPVVFAPPAPKPLRVSDLATPAPAAQSAAGETAAESVNGARPANGAQPVTGAEPANGAQPVTGAEPVNGAQPVAAANAAESQAAANAAESQAASDTADADGAAVDRAAAVDA